MDIAKLSLRIDGVIVPLCELTDLSHASISDNEMLIEGMLPRDAARALVSGVYMNREVKDWHVEIVRDGELVGRGYGSGICIKCVGRPAIDGRVEVEMAIRSSTAPFSNEIGSAFL